LPGFRDRFGSDLVNVLRQIMHYSKVFSQNVLSPY